MARNDFQMQMNGLHERLGEMAAHAKGMLRDGVRAFERLDRGLAEDVDARKDRLADLDDQIEETALRVLALQNPMAGDLRRIGASIKLITYLNRIGRYGRDIGNTLNRLGPDQQHAFSLVDLPAMAENVLTMLDLALAAFDEQKAPDVAAIERLEDEVDTMRRRIWDSCIVHMMENNRNIEICAHYMMVARYLERCGDNVCKVTEKLHYAATGQRIMVK